MTINKLRDSMYVSVAQSIDSSIGSIYHSIIVSVWQPVINSVWDSAASAMIRELDEHR